MGNYVRLTSLLLKQICVWVLTSLCRLQVNVISTALRIILHLPKLIETAKKHTETVPRIVYVSCGAHYESMIPAEVIDAPNMLKGINEERKGDNVE